MDDAIDVITGDGLQWLSEFSDLRRALAAYLCPPQPAEPGYVAKFGSLAGAQVGVAVALELGDPESAVRLWTGVLQREFYRRHPDVLLEAREAIQSIQRLNSSPSNEPAAGT